MNKKKLKILDPEDVIEKGKDIGDLRPRTEIAVIASPLGQHTLAGYKCDHGVYIPCTSTNPDRAPFCTLCYPYIIQEKEDATQGQTGISEQPNHGEQSARTED